MKHTDLYAKYQALDAQERRELVAAVKAHGGEYIFPKCDEDGDDNRPVVCASFKHADDPGDYTVTRVAVDDEYGALSLFTDAPKMMRHLKICCTTSNSITSATSPQPFQKRIRSRTFPRPLNNTC